MFGLECNTCVCIVSQRQVLDGTTVRVGYIALLTSMLMGNMYTLRIVTASRIAITIILTLVFPDNVTGADVLTDVGTTIVFASLGALLHRIWQTRYTLTKQKLETNAYLTSLLFHETRTPMQLILSATYELNEDPPKHRRKEILEELTQQVNNVMVAQTIIDEYENIDTPGATCVKARECNVAAKVEQLAAAYTEKQSQQVADAAQRNIMSVHSSLEADEELPVDWHHLRYGLSILLDSISRRVTNAAIDMHVNLNNYADSLCLCVEVSPGGGAGSSPAVAEKCDGDKTGHTLSISNEFVQIASTLFQHDAFVNHMSMVGGIDSLLVLSRRVFELLECQYSFECEGSADVYHRVLFRMQLPLHGYNASSTSRSEALDPPSMSASLDALESLTEAEQNLQTQQRIQDGSKSAKVYSPANGVGVTGMTSSAEVKEQCHSSRIMPMEVQQHQHDLDQTRSISNTPSTSEPAQVLIHNSVASITATTILVVDDNTMIRRVLTMLVNALGYQTREAVDGVEAVESVRASKPDLILMDLQMPRLNGIEATIRIREELGYSREDLPVLAVSAGGLKSDVAACRASGFNGYYTKPVSKDVLAEAIRYHHRRDRVGWREGKHRV